MNKYLLITIATAALTVFGAYAQNANTFKDSRDGKTYKTVKIGVKVWMAENLNYAAEESVCYKNKAANCAKYGRLYNWETANKACPAGYHLPSDEEWIALVDYAGGEEKAGKKLKSAKGWNKKGNGTDDFGFSALPGGGGNDNGYFDNTGNNGDWWSATEDGAGYAWSRDMSYGYESVDRYHSRKTNLFSVRCVQN